MASGASIFKIFGSLSDSLPSRVLASLGIGFISSASTIVAVNTLVSLVQNNFSSMSGVLLQILSLSGFTTGGGILLGAFIAKAAFQGFSTLGKISQ